jgi:hypothetical protein
MSVFESILLDANGKRRWSDISNVDWMVHRIVTEEYRRARQEFNLEPGSITEIVINRILNRLDG